MTEPHRACRVLVVEDEALIALMLETMLEELGHSVTALARGVSDALALIETRRDEIDGALLDANLAGTSAAPIAEALRAAGLPYVLTSGYDPVELARLGFDAPVLRKPYLKSEVGQALAGWSCPG